MGFHLFECSSEELSDVEGIPHREDTHLHPLSAGNLNGDDTITCSSANLMVHIGVHCTDYQAPPSHPSWNGDARLCGHKFPDILSLVE